jgi:hypothetical protein
LTPNTLHSYDSPPLYPPHSTIHIPLINRLINTCWYFFKFGLAVLLAVALAIGVYFYSRMDDEIRQFAEQMLSGQFPQLNVSVGGARLVKNRGIAIYDLSLTETSTTRRQSNLLVIDEVLVVCDIQLAKLVHGVPKIEQIVVKRPQLWITRETDGRLNIESLWPVPKCGNQQPKIEIHNALVALSDRSHPDLQPLILRDMNLNFIREQRPPGPTLTKPTLATTTANIRTGDLNANPILIESPPMRIEGTCASTHLQGAKFQARIDLCQQKLSASGEVDQLKLTEQLQPWIALLQEMQTGGSSSAPLVSVQLPTVLGVVNGKFQVEYDQASSRTPRFAVSAQISHGQIVHERLPYPLTEMTGTLQCTNRMLQLSEIRARCGSAAITVSSFMQSGWQPDAPKSLALQIEHLTMDESLRSKLPSLVQAQWQKYQPTGLVDAELQATFDGFRWQHRANLKGQQLAFESEKFQYRLKDGYGTLTTISQQGENPARLDLDLTGQGGGQPIRIVGQVFDPGPAAAGWVELSGQGLEIETDMIDALPLKARRVITSMRPTGKIDFRWRVDRTQPGQFKPRTTLQLVLADCDILYEKFPYPLRHIRGEIKAEDNRWQFLDLVSGGSHRVRCHGSLLPIPANQGMATEHELKLNFIAEQIPLDEDLRKAVPAEVQKAWKQIDPRGSADFTAQVLYRTGFTQPNIRVTIEPRSESASIRPTFFPYLIEGLSGSIMYNAGQLVLSQLQGHHANTTIRTNGDGYFGPQGDWQFQLVGLSADRVIANRDLNLALPLGLRKVIDQLHPNGDFNLHNGVFHFSRGASPLAPVQTRWDFQLATHQTDLQVGIDLTNVHGGVHLVGSSDGRHTRCAGELELDSATFLDVQFTNIRGPLWIDDETCLLGQEASRRQQKTPRRLTAMVYDGQLGADASVTLGGRPNYQVVADLTTANVTRMATERFGGQTDVSGTLSATLNLQGSGQSEHTLRGDGEIQIRDANIYELPLLVSLLNVLRSRTPSTTAFNQCDMKFRLQGRHILLDQIDFLGDAVSLYGKGTADFDQKLKLVFYGTLGRNDYRVPLLQWVVARTNERIMQLYVDGTLAEPNVQTQAFPGISLLMQQIQMNLDAPPAITQRQPNALDKDSSLRFGHRR